MEGCGIEGVSAFWVSAWGCLPRGGCLPWVDRPPPPCTALVGTHPSGMHTCSISIQPLIRYVLPGKCLSVRRRGSPM